jgi:hypothetical protein
VKFVRKWREARRERKLRRLAELDPAERQRLLDEQSPMKAKWGYYPKCV